MKMKKYISCCFFYWQITSMSSIVTSCSSSGSFLYSSALGLTLRWRQNGRDSVSNHQPHDCLLNRLFRRRSKKTSKLRVTGLCARNSPGTGEFPAQMASYAENVSIWWRHHDFATHRVYMVLCSTKKWCGTYINTSPNSPISQRFFP